MRTQRHGRRRVDRAIPAPQLRASARRFEVSCEDAWSSRNGTFDVETYTLNVVRDRALVSDGEVVPTRTETAA